MKYYALLLLFLLGCADELIIPKSNEKRISVTYTGNYEEDRIYGEAPATWICDNDAMIIDFRVVTGSAEPHHIVDAALFKNTMIHKGDSLWLGPDGLYYGAWINNDLVCTTAIDPWLLHADRYPYPHRVELLIKYISQGMH